MLKKFAKIKLTKGKKAFLIRLVVFLLAYGLVSFFYQEIKELFGQPYYKVNENYLSKFIYFLIILIIYLQRKKISKLKSYKNSILQTLIFGILAAGFFAIPPENLMVAGIPHKIAYFILYGFGQLSIFFAVFNTKIFSLKYLQEEILFAICILIGILTTHFIVNGFWPIFFTPLAWTLRAVLPLMAEDTHITTLENGFGVKMNEFIVEVGPPCAGIYSLIAFSLLFLTAIYFSKEKYHFDSKKTIIAFLAGLAVIYTLNIIRIALIIFIGAHFSQALAINLFHEYLSAIFLMATFIIYLNYIIPKLAIKKKKTRVSSKARNEHKKNPSNSSSTSPRVSSAARNKHKKT